MKLSRLWKALLWSGSHQGPATSFMSVIPLVNHQTNYTQTESTKTSLDIFSLLKPSDEREMKRHAARRADDAGTFSAFGAAFTWNYSMGSSGLNTNHHTASAESLSTGASLSSVPSVQTRVFAEITSPSDSRVCRECFCFLSERVVYLKVKSFKHAFVDSGDNALSSHFRSTAMLVRVWHLRASAQYQFGVKQCHCMRCKVNEDGLFCFADCLYCALQDWRIRWIQSVDASLKHNPELNAKQKTFIHIFFYVYAFGVRLNVVDVSFQFYCSHCWKWDLLWYLVLYLKI